MNGAQVSHRHIFVINEEVLVMNLISGQDVVARALEDFTVWNLMGYISDSQFSEVEKCFTGKSFSITALLKIPGFISHTRD